MIGNAYMTVSITPHSLGGLCVCVFQRYEMIILSVFVESMFWFI